MKRGETLATRLKPGLYRLHWNGGGSSLAAVGCLDNGVNWFAPTNWVAEWPGGIACIVWELVERVEPIVDPDAWYAEQVALMADRAPA